MTNLIENIKEGFSVIKEELEELDRRTDFNRLFLDKMLNKMNLMDDNADILEYLDVDDSDDYYDDDREEHFGIVSLTLMFVALAAITAIPCLADLITDFFAAASPLLFLFFIIFLFFVFYPYFFLAYYICI